MNLKIALICLNFLAGFGLQRSWGIIQTLLRGFFISNLCGKFITLQATKINSLVAGHH